MIPIRTKGVDGIANGWLLTIWNEKEDAWRPSQVYLTVVDPGGIKGPHLHRERCGRFLCIKGDVLIVTQDVLDPDRYEERRTGEQAGFDIVMVPPGTAAALYNDSLDPAYVLNMPTPAWEPINQDEWPVENWRFRQ